MRPSKPERCSSTPVARRRRRHVATAVVFLALELLMALLGAFHSLEVDHVRCAEHGELIHVEHRDEATPVVTGIDETEERQVAPGTSRGEHDHDVCMLARVRDEEQTAIAPADDTASRVPPATVTAALVAPASTRAPPTSRRLRLSLAPKTSPPGPVQI